MWHVVVGQFSTSIDNQNTVKATIDHSIFRESSPIGHEPSAVIEVADPIVNYETMPKHQLAWHVDLKNA